MEELDVALNLIFFVMTIFDLLEANIVIASNNRNIL